MDAINELEQVSAEAANELNNSRVVSSSSSSLVSVLNTTTYQINCTNCFNFRRRSRAISKNKQHARKVLVGKRSLKSVDLLPAAAAAGPASYSTAAQFSIKFHRFAFRSPVNNKLSRTPIMLNQRCCLSVSVVPSDRNNKAHKKRNVNFFFT